MAESVEHALRGIGVSDRRRDDAMSSGEKGATDRATDAAGADDGDVQGRAGKLR
jgi:hypothetical protein